MSTIQAARELFEEAETMGSLERCDKAIEMLRNLVDDIPDLSSHPLGSTVSKMLAKVRLSRVNLAGPSSSLDDTIAALQNYMTEFTSELDDEGNDAGKVALAQAFLERFREKEKRSDLDEATVLFQKLLHDCPPGDPRLPGFLQNVGTCFYLAFNLDRTPSLLNNAIDVFRKCAAWYSGHGQDIPTPVIVQFADSLYDRYDLSKQVSDLEESASLLERYCQERQSNPG